LRTAKVRQQYNLAFLFEQMFQSREQAANTRIIRHTATAHRYVQIPTYQNGLAFQADICNAFHPIFAHRRATSNMRSENAHSLSYQEATRQSFPPITLVPVKSTIELYGVWV